MREIKFRAESGGEFVYGLVSYDEDGDVILTTELGWTFDIDEETIGQYTGLKDKNGVEIYEGDIVDCWDSVDVLSQSAAGVGIIGTVDFNGGCFCVKSCDGYQDRLALTCAENVEIIGNVCQNPELLRD